MIKAALIFLLGVLPCVASSAGQPTGDLDNAFRLVLASKGLIVHDIATRIDIADGRGTHLGTIEKVESLDPATEKRFVVSKHVTGKPGFWIAFSMGFEDHPEESLMRYDRVTGMTLEKGVDGPQEVISVCDKEGAWEGRLWFRSSDHRLLRASYVVHKPPFLGVKTLEYTVTFEAGSNGACLLPRCCDIKASGSMLFITRKLLIHQDYKGWNPGRESQ